MSPLPEAWRTARTRVASVRSSEALPLTSLFNSSADVAALDPTFQPVETPEVLALIEESERDRHVARGFRMQSIRLLEKDEPIGYYHLREDVPRPGIVAFTIFLIGRGYRSEGFGREVGAALLEHLKADPANRAAWAQVFLENRRALAFWIELGFSTMVEHKHAFVRETEEGHASLILEADFERESVAFPREYGQVPIAFEVTEVLDVLPPQIAVSAPEAVRSMADLVPRRLDVPYRKDYDTVAGDAPADWARRFDLSHWKFFIARSEGRPVGAAAVAFDTPEVEMLERRRDLAVLWDIRVAPEARGRGAGRALFRLAEAWAHSKGCVELKVETQNINVPACRFYERQGCVLRSVNRGAYPDLPHEIQLLWYKDLSGAGGSLRS